MSEGKGRRGGAKTPIAISKDSKTPRTPEAQGLRNKAAVDAAARQASMGNPEMLEKYTPGKIRVPVNTEEVKGMVSYIRDQMLKNPSAVPPLLDLRDAESAKHRAGQEAGDFEDEDSLYDEGLQFALDASSLELEASHRENAVLREQFETYKEAPKQSYLDVFPDPMVAPKPTQVAATKNGKVLPKRSSSSPPPLELLPASQFNQSYVQRLVNHIDEQAKENSALFGAISSLQQSLSPLAPPRPTGSGAGAGPHGSTVFRPDSSAANSSSSRTSNAKGNNRSVHLSTSPSKSGSRTHTERDDDDEQRSQFSDDTVEADSNVSAEESREAAIDRIPINFGGQPTSTSLTPDELLSLMHSTHVLELLTLDGGVAVFRGDASMKHPYQLWWSAYIHFAHP